MTNADGGPAGPPSVWDHTIEFCGKIVYNGYRNTEEDAT